MRRFQTIHEFRPYDAVVYPEFELLVAVAVVPKKVHFVEYRATLGNPFADFSSYVSFLIEFAT